MYGSEDNMNDVNNKMPSLLKHCQGWEAGKQREQKESS